MPEMLQRRAAPSTRGAVRRSWEASDSPEQEIKVLFVDDDDLYRDTVQAELAEEGFSVMALADGESLLANLEEAEKADVIILDWRLKGLEGIDLLPRLRENGVVTPVVFLTGRNSPVHERLAFDRGAVDFIDKARGIGIVVTRLRLVASRARMSTPCEPESVLAVGELVLKLDISRAYWRGIDVELTSGEYRIVHLLASKGSTYVPYRHIYDVLHHKGFLAGSGETGYRTNVRCSIKRIRIKLVKCDPAFDEIKNYNGFGYCWGTGTQD